MVRLLYLKQAYGLSNDQVVQRCAQNILLQFFNVRIYLEHRLPCDFSLISRFRKDLGEPGVELLMKATIETAVTISTVKTSDLQRVIVDTTVAEKAIAHPTDSRLLEVSRKKLVRMAKRSGIILKQTHDKECSVLHRRTGGYAHAKLFCRLQRVVKRQRTIRGVLIREVQCKLAALRVNAQAQLQSLLVLASRLCKQKRSDKSAAKVFALHAPEVSCIGKGKSVKPHEFGNRSSIAVAHKAGLVVGARSYLGNPYDGHTLVDQLGQFAILLQDIGVKPHTAVVDLGFNGVDADNPGVEIIRQGKFKKLSKQRREWLRRRQAVEPTIGHLKDDHRLRRCWLNGEMGDAPYAVLCDLNFNIRWLMVPSRQRASGTCGSFFYACNLPRNGIPMPPWRERALCITRSHLESSRNRRGWLTWASEQGVVEFFNTD